MGFGGGDVSWSANVCCECGEEGEMEIGER